MRVTVTAALVLLTIAGAELTSQVGSVAVDAAPIRQALSEGQYAVAERLAVDGVAGSQAAKDAKATAQASDLLVEALTRNGKIGEPRTIALAQKLVADKTALFGSVSLDLADSLDNLGTLSTARGEFANAVVSHERALAIRRRAGQSGAASVAGTLERLAEPLIWLERFSEARGALDEAKRIREPASVTAPLALAQTFYLDALLHRWDGRYDAAARALESALRLRVGRSADHPDNIAMLELDGDLEFFKGNVRQAERLWANALTLAERRLGATHPVVPPLLRRLAIVAQELGDLDSKRRLLERARSSAPGPLAPCYTESLTLLNDFGTLATYGGDFQQARNFYRQAFTKSRQCLGPSHSMTTTILHNRALLAADMGDLADAENLQRQAVRAWSQRLGADHPFVATGLEELAGVVASRGRTAEASQLLTRALAMRTKKLGPESPDVASTLVTLARTVSASDPTTAGRRVDQAIAIYERGNRPQNPDSVAAAYSLRGTLLLKRGEYDQAREAFATTLAERDRVFGANHPLTAAARASLAASEFGLGSSDAAVRDALAAEQIGRDHLRFTIRYLPERQALAYADKRPRGLDLALSAVADGRTAGSEGVLDAMIRSRGVILDELGARVHLASQSADPVLATLNAAATTARERFANLMMRSLVGSDPVPRASLDEARANKEAAERALAERSADARGEIDQANVGLVDIRKMLPDGMALVSFARYDRTTVTRSGARLVPHTTASYIAFVTRADSPQTDVVPLGPASTIDAAVNAWRTQLDGHSVLGVAMPDAERAYRVAGAAVRRRIWDPIAPFVRGVSQVLVVPDGAINLVSFAALPTGTSRYLIEDAPILHYLSTERDIVANASPTEGRGLLAVGGPAFGDRGKPAQTAGALRNGCTSLAGLHFDDLPGSGLEAAEVARIWSSSTADGSNGATILRGRAATTTTVKRDAIGRRVIHLATHGFFLQSSCAPSVAGTRGIGGIASGAASPQQAENPLLLAGLAFAGANVLNARVSGNDDGILTAEEIAGLNLQGTEWVVLSACDTGVGQIKAGEGVFGLRRAFHVAGVRTIIMSLWSVEDRSTQVWMRYLYDARFNRRLSTAASVQDASLRALRERRARRVDTHPFFWAGFVAAGSWQ